MPKFLCWPKFEFPPVLFWLWDVPYSGRHFHESQQDVLTPRWPIPKVQRTDRARIQKLWMSLGPTGPPSFWLMQAFWITFRHSRSPPPSLQFLWFRLDQTLHVFFLLSWVFSPFLLDYLQTFSFRWITWWSEMWHFDVIPCVIQPQLCNEKPTNNNNDKTIFYFRWFLPCTPPASSQNGTYWLQQNLGPGCLAP